MEEGLRQIIGPSFDDDMHALLTHEHWYHDTLSGSELFCFWVRDNLERCREPSWVFNTLRASERTLLASSLGVDKSRIVGKSPSAFAAIVLEAAGLPHAEPVGLRHLLERWRGFIEGVEAGNDEKVAVQCRQAAERLFKTIAYTYLHSSYGALSLEILKSPGSLRFPKVLENASLPDDIGKRIIVDGVADLGFLLLFVRKLSSKSESLQTESPPPITLFTQDEFDAFQALATALQAYAHDKPSLTTTRTGALLAALQATNTSIGAMIGRRMMPDEGVVLESCLGYFGPVVRCVFDSGKERRLVVRSAPTLGSRIYLLASVDRDYSFAEWAPSPW